MSLAVPAHEARPRFARQAPRGMLAVLVVYQRGLDAVPAWSQLTAWLAESPGALGMHIAHVLVYDNSPAPIAQCAAPGQGVTVIHDAANGGTRAAYAEALRLARAQGLKWLLLLDHDTRLPGDFLARLDEAMQQAGSVAHAAWLPRIVSHGRLISPGVMQLSGVVRPMSDITECRDQGASTARRMTAIASGSVLAVEAMASVPAPPPTMWLDGIDHWYFLQLQRHGHSMACFDSVLVHDLSVMDYRGLSAARAASILAANRTLLRVLPWQASLTYPARVLWFLLKLGRCNPGALRGLSRGIVRKGWRHG